MDDKERLENEAIDTEFVESDSNVDNEKIGKDSEGLDTPKVETKPVKKKVMTAKSFAAIIIAIIIASGAIGYSVYEYNRAKAGVDAVMSHNYESNGTTGTSTSEVTSSSLSDEDLWESYVTDREADNGITGTTRIVHGEYGDYAVDEAGREWELGEGVNDPENNAMATMDTEETLAPISFNPQKDINADSSLIGISTISVDGIILDFPVDYNTVSSKFTLIRDENESVDAIDPDEIINDEISLMYKSKTGTGNVWFTFSSEGASKKLSECKLVKMEITSIIHGTPTNHNMSIALGGGVNFGDDYDTIKSKFPDVPVDHLNKYPAFMLIYEKDGYKYYFFGDNNGLTQVTIEF